MNLVLQLVLEEDKIFVNDISNNYQIKKNKRTERITLEDNDIMNKIEKIPIYSSKTKNSPKKKKKYVNKVIYIK